MKSSHSKTTQTSTASESNTPSSSTARNRDDSLSSAARREQQQDFSQVGGNEDISSSPASAHARNEFSNIQEQGQYSPSAENFSSYEAAGSNRQASEQQGDYSQYQSQDSANARRNNQQQARPSDIMAQTGINTLVDAWANLVLGQVQIATQAAIRLAQCCFSPSLISNISEVQRQYAEDSISSASTAASKLAQLTPRALNQNQNQFQNQQGQNQQAQGQQGQGQQPQNQRYSAQTTVRQQYS